MAPFPSKEVMPIRVVVIGVIFSIIAIVAVCARFWARRIRKVALQLNDMLILGALAFTLGQNAIIMTAAIAGGAGQHVSALTQSEIVVLGKVIEISVSTWDFANKSPIAGRRHS